MAALLLLAAPAARADVLRLRGNVEHHGSFAGFVRDQFRFETADGQKLDEICAKVLELKMEPPANVIVKPHGKKKREDLKLVGFRDSVFQFSTGKQTISMTSPTVTSIQMALDFNRPAFIGTHQESGDRKDLDVATLVQPGMATIIQFHMSNVVVSVRQGNYVAALAARSEKEVKFVRIDLSSFDAPVARKYAVLSVPQFWFFNTSGQLTRKLTDRFTEEDIDSALKEARQGR